MPEVAEVETIRRQLARRIRGREIVGLEVSGRRVLRRAHAPAIAQLIGDTVHDVERVGKFLLLRCRARGALVVHLGMSGRFVLGAAPSEGSHVALRVRLADEVVLEMVDPRTFGEAFWVPPYEGRRPAALAHLGPDVLDPLDEVAAASGTRALGSARWVKRLLIDQRVLAGLGNMYADEACFGARIDPRVPGRALGSRRWRQVVAAAQAVAAEALGAGGTTFPDRSYRNLEGEGMYYDRLAVYRRTGLPCAVCQTPIARVPFDGRYTHYCPTCQRGT